MRCSTKDVIVLHPTEPHIDCGNLNLAADPDVCSWESEGHQQPWDVICGTYQAARSGLAHVHHCSMWDKIVTTPCSLPPSRVREDHGIVQWPMPEETGAPMLCSKQIWLYKCREAVLFLSFRSNAQNGRRGE